MLAYRLSDRHSSEETTAKVAVFFVEFVQWVYCAPQATGIKIAPVLEAMVTIAASLVLAFFYGWKLTLVILAFLPVMVLAGKVHGKAVGGSAKSEASNVLEAGKVRVSVHLNACLCLPACLPAYQLYVCWSLCLSTL